LELQSPSLVVQAINKEDAKNLERLKNKIPSALIETLNTFAESTSIGLGFNVDDFKHIHLADQQPSRLNFLIQKATWFALGGDILKNVFGNNITADAHVFIWEFYYKHVQNRGPYPSIKIGDIPYGILPVSHWRKILGETSVHNSTDLNKKLRKILAFLGEEWLNMAKKSRLVPRMDEGVADRDEELATMLSMSPTSTNLQLRILELERMKGKLPEWLEKGVTTPQNLYSYPPKLVDELLKGKQGYNKNFNYVEEASKEITDQFKDFLPHSHHIIYALQHTFKEIGVANFANLGFPLTLDDDWYKTDFLKRVEEILDNQESFFYNGKTNFLLYELLNSSRVNALSLYNQKISFDPKNIADVKDITSYTIQITPSQQAKIVAKKTFTKGETIATLISTPGNKVIKLKAPISGIITKAYVKSNDKIENAKRIFIIKNKTKYDQVNKKMGALFAQIILEIERLRVAGKDHIKAQHTAIMEALDLSSFRLDAWITGLAQSQLLKLRNIDKSKKGFYYGAYGWVEDLKLLRPIATKNEITNKESEDSNSSDGGIIHAPSSAQAITAAMFRQSFAAYNKTVKDGENKPNPFTLNLTSDRIQRAQQLMDGLRGGQELEALLGYKFERFLHDHKKDALIPDLRKKFPLEINKISGGQQVGLPTMTVVNGLSLMKEYSGNNEIVLKGIDLIKNILDGSTDVLLYEAGFQMIQGNYSQSAAAMDAAKGKLAPPKTTGLNTHLPSIGQIHKLVMLFEPPTSSRTTPGKNPKAYVTPVLDQWLQKIVGPLSEITIIINFYRIVDDLISGEKEKEIMASHAITIDKLDIGYLDLLLLGQTDLNNDATELEQRIIQKAKQELEKSGLQWADDLIYEIRDTDSNLSALLLTIEYINNLLKTSRHLTTEDVATYEDYDENEGSSRLVPYEKQELIKIKTRLQTCITQLQSTSSTEILAKYHIDNAKSIFSIVEATERIQLEKRAREEATNKATQAQTLIDTWKEEMTLQGMINLLESVKEILFGKSFPLIFPFNPPASFKTNLAKNQARLVGNKKIKFPDNTSGGEEKIMQWVEGRAQINNQTEAFSDFLMVCKNWTTDETLNQNTYLKNFTFKIAQNTPEGEFPWIALDKEAAKILRKSRINVPYKYPKDSQSIVVYTPPITLTGSKQYGLFIDQFTEKIPEQVVNTGVAFQYNGPNNEAPQAILLAVPADNTEEFWVEDTLRDIVLDSIDLTKIRMVDTDALQKFASVLPMAFWQKTPNPI